MAPCFTRENVQHPYTGVPGVSPHRIGGGASVFWHVCLSWSDYRLQSPRLCVLPQAAHSTEFLSEFTEHCPCLSNKLPKPTRSSSTKSSLIIAALINLTHVWNSLTQMGMDAHLHHSLPSWQWCYVEHVCMVLLSPPLGHQAELQRSLTTTHQGKSSPSVNFQCDICIKIRK